jgi:hypothetical protein
MVGLCGLPPIVHDPSDEDLSPGTAETLDGWGTQLHLSRVGFAGGRLGCKRLI